MIAGARDRLQRVAIRISHLAAVRRIQAVLAGAEEAGGNLLAAGLAFRALFAMLPALLLLVGLTGWAVGDPEARAAIIADIVRRVPPLEGAIADTLDQLVRERSTISLIGLLGSLWGASSFYGSLDTAMSRLFPGGKPRGPIEQRIRGVLGVVVLLGAAVATVLLGSAWSYAETALGGREAGVWRLAGPVLTALVMVVAVFVLFRIVPTAPPSPRAALPPAIVAGVGLALLTDLFALLAPRLVGGLAAFGVFAALFAALLWLDYGFQLLVDSAAWARLRRDDQVEAFSGEAGGEV
jgi:YihY family inner membrane protein